MKKALFILLLFLPLSLWSQNYYVAAPPLGNDDTGDGSTETPWATVSHACGQVTTSGHVINLMTDITDNDRAILRVGVSLVGMGTKKITTSYVASSTSNAYLYAYSASTTNGAKSTIAYIHFDGNNLTATRAIWIGYRGNVEIHHCTIEDFLYAGIHFRNQIDWVNPPATYATGNSVHHNTFINCSHMHNGDPGQLRLDGQDGMLIYNNTFDQRQRTAGNNGAHVRTCNVQNIKMYSNTFYHNDNEVVASGDWAFFGELWHNKGDFEIYDNTFYGHSTLDLAGFENEIIAGNTFGYKVYRNKWLNNVKTNPVLISPDNYSHQYAITIEGTDQEYIYVYNNLIQRYGYGIEIATGYKTSSIPALNFLHDHFYFYNNIFEDMGYATYTYSAAIVLINEVNDPGYTNTSSNWWIVNNVMTGANRCYNGIRFTIIGTGENINIKNNIIYDFASYGVYITKRTTDVTSISNSAITYNDLYSNGNDAVYINSGITQSSVNTTTGNITPNPLFTDLSAGNFRLQATSPCISAGTYIGAPVLTDYAGQGWINPPSIGVYEAGSDARPTVTTTAISLITTTTATTGGNVTSDGGLAVTARGVCYATGHTPTIADSKTNNGTGTGTFISYLNHLTASTTYRARAYATNEAGTSYGTERSFTTASEEGPGVVISGPLLKRGTLLLKHNGILLKK